MHFPKKHSKFEIRMPHSMLFGINTNGKAFGLPTNGKKWREFPYFGLELKQISAVPSFLWAVGGDRQVYLLVHGLDIPIRIKEEVYENERWVPIEGFGKRLLPTDRHLWSDKDGTTERRKEAIKLPSMAWQWENDWQLELNLEGHPLDYDGWTYAIDFPATYNPTKQWSSCVRRRKWFRYRRYAAMYAWCAISPLHKDPTKEPFMDISIGGQNKIEENKGMLFVWAITVHGRIMFRSGVTSTAPDGVRWLHVPSPKTSDVRSVCCGPAGVLWAVLWDGQAAVRYGITYQCPIGESWLEVAPPEKDIKFIQVSVGLNSVWAITNDHRVWFRKGIRSDRNHASEELLKGTGWVEMVGEMISISVSANDHVFAVSKADKRMYFRSGINAAELMGRKWRLIEAKTQNSGSYSQGRADRSSRSSLQDNTSTNDPVLELGDERVSTSLPVNMHLDSCSSTLSNEEDSRARESIKLDVDSLTKNMRSWSPIHSASSVLAMEASPDTDESSFDSDMQREVFREKDDLSANCEQEKTLWNYVCGSAVVIDSFNLPKWFVDDSYNEEYSNSMEPWRNSILSKLKKRNTTDVQKFDSYEIAVKTTSWTKSAKCKCTLPGSEYMEECVIELEWIENNATGPDSGTLAVLTPNKENALLNLSLSEITCVMNCSEPNQPSLSINTVRSVENNSSLRLYFAFENDFEDWLQSVSTICYQINDIVGFPNKQCIWCTNELGEIYVSDPSPLQKNQATKSGKFFSELNVRNVSAPFKIPLLNGFPINTEITINGFVPGNADRFFLNLICGMSDDIAFHFNPRFCEQTIVRNSSVSGKWGSEEKDGKFLMQTDSDFTLAILCLEKKIKIFLNGLTYTYYQHRVSPENITDLCIGGHVEVFNILYETTKVILNLPELSWRKIDGHLKKVETCSEGVTWGLSYNFTPWVYTGCISDKAGTSGGKTSVQISQMIDTKYMYVYENQRWNPLTGFTTLGLPTDRCMWSDETGRIKLSKESIKLQNMHWQWTTDWQIDYTTPSGVDQDGWQYAVDFPATYHPSNNITDTVRRRRWIRICRLVTSGPWEDVGNTKLKDVTLSILNGASEPIKVAVWAITVNGDVLYRDGVSSRCIIGEKWEHVQANQPMKCISAGGTHQVWCCGENGVLFWRFGISVSNPTGDAWEYVEPYNGCTFQNVAVGKWTVWALDSEGDLYVRREITPVFPEGTHWRRVTNNDNKKFKHICASEENIWALTRDGILCRRIGISQGNPEGVSWMYGLSGNWQHISE